MKLSCELCSFSHKLFNSEPSAEKPHSTYDCKNLNARMVMVPWKVEIVVPCLNFWLRYWDFLANSISLHGENM